MGLGDRCHVEPGWAGNPGSRRRIEALSIRPRDGLAPSSNEFRVFAQDGRATAWVSDGSYAGTRGRSLPLTGFAVRSATALSERIEIAYEESFFEGGVIGPKRNGELCVSPIADDPLEAVRVTIIDQGEAADWQSPARCRDGAPPSPSRSANSRRTTGRSRPAGPRPRPGSLAARPG